ncbi:nicotinamide riboside transporter PnuC [Ideonella azotifigens]|uniref:Nicotinamide riboside transporter PnuC n=1 Tax=Ideonella azotifigens TaxID=513160 RepID=A0ABN1KJI2_9BURK|nr:nicotinamide riboside transporter PnuC [Ideonella azotifigens]MCD2339388.1 nicotinamide riboside transporter PnuC [Ideonella azotifigens]
MNLADLSPLEWAANLVTALSVLLAAQARVATWPTGIIGSALFGWLFWQNQLYADLTLQLFFIATSASGWWQWQRAGGPAATQQRQALAGRSLLGMVLAGLVVALAYGALLQRFTQAYAPFWDSAVLVTSVIAQVLLMRGHHQTWPAWLVVNTLSVPLYLSRGLFLTAGLYTLFWLNAWYGWWRWHRLQHRAPALA